MMVEPRIGSGADLIECGLQVVELDLFVVGDSRGGQGVVSEAVDLSRQTMGGLEQGFGGWHIEQGEFTADQTQAMFEVVW